MWLDDADARAVKWTGLVQPNPLKWVKPAWTGPHSQPTLSSARECGLVWSSTFGTTNRARNIPHIDLSSYDPFDDCWGYAYHYPLGMMINTSWISCYHIV